MKSDSEKYNLRPAVQSDFAEIKSLIRAVQINPMGLKWQNFLVVTDSIGKIIGCAQIKSHQDGSRELASIAVREAWRRRGIASSLIKRLLEEHQGTLYLTCRAELGLFYTRFGFHTIQYEEMPPYFQRIWRIARLVSRTGLIHDSLLVMRRN